MKMVIDVKGKTKTFCLQFDGEPEFLEEWWSEGLDVGIVVNEIPTWLPGELVNLWCWIQDFFCKEL